MQYQTDKESVVEEATKLQYAKRGSVLVKNLQKRHFEAYYCENKEEALKKALELIPQGALVGWGGTMTAKQIGLLEALNQGNYVPLDREKGKTPEEVTEIKYKCFHADFFISGTNGISLDGQLVNLDGNGSRVAPFIFGPKNVLVVVGMNKVTDTVEEAVKRVRTVAAPMNQQRFLRSTPCTVTGSCGNCLSEDCICNQLVITRHCSPMGRIKIISIGENLGF